ncbi:MAG: hypothetical protein ACKV2V_27250 [Blastocatellia bacterium]
MQTHPRLSIAVIFLLFLLLTAYAGGPVFWRVNTRAEIEKGDIQSVSVADNGALTLAPALTELYDTKQAYIWSAAADNAGNVYLGTGHDGRIFRVDASGRGDLLYKTSELDVMALAIDKTGNVYAGTAPDGKVYRITPQGNATVFFEPKTKYIWSLAFDPQGRLLVGTGDKGVIYRVAPDGKGAAWVNTTQTSITALKVDGAGNVIAGTDPGGLVLRITPDGKTFALYDSPLREIHDLAVGRDGAVYALAIADAAGSGAANAASASGSSSAPTVIAADEGVTVTISDVQILDGGGATSTAATGSRGAGDQAKSAVYRIDASGVADVLWDAKDMTAFAIALRDDESVLIGTGSKGRIFSLPKSAAGHQNPVLLAQSSEAQTARFVQARGQLYAAASNLGKFLRLGPDTAASGTYTSAARDAVTSGTWGRISWIADGEVELQTRSGNTAAPDSTWGEWSAVYKTNDSGRDGVAITSPRARYLQWRATLKKGAAAAPRLREVTVSWLPRNVAPSLNTITTLPVGVALQPLPGQLSDPAAELAGLDVNALGNQGSLPPRRLFQRGALSLQWTAEDRNSDNLEYSLLYRSYDATEFLPLKTGMRETWHTIDGNALPDGRYIFRVVASDAPSNPADLALTHSIDTEPLEVDNTAPVLTVETPRVAAGKAEIAFRAADTTSIIRRAEYQVDGGAWKALFPVDGIADSRREEYRVPVSLPDARPHVGAFRCLDANGNIGGAQVVVK